jgi:hypothetical protein
MGNTAGSVGSGIGVASGRLTTNNTRITATLPTSPTAASIWTT